MDYQTYKEQHVALEKQAMRWYKRWVYGFISIFIVLLWGILETKPINVLILIIPTGISLGILLSARNFIHSLTYLRECYERSPPQLKKDLTLDLHTYLQEVCLHEVEATIRQTLADLDRAHQITFIIDEDPVPLSITLWGNSTEESGYVSEIHVIPGSTLHGILLGCIEWEAKRFNVELEFPI